jgi:hypothetical protein
VDTADTSCTCVSVDIKESSEGITSADEDGDCGGDIVPVSESRLLYFLLDENIQAR